MERNDDTPGTQPNKPRALSSEQTLYIFGGFLGTQAGAMSGIGPGWLQWSLWIAGTIVFIYGLAWDTRPVEMVESSTGRRAAWWITMMLLCFGGPALYAQYEGECSPERIDEAWDVLYMRRGPGAGGRGDALELLNRCNESLFGIDLSHASLEQLSVPGAALSNARFDSTDIAGANFRRDTLLSASFVHVNAFGAGFYKATLRNANMMGADLTATNLTEIDGFRMNLDSALLYNADLNDARLFRAQMRGTKLDFAELRNTNMTRAGVHGASFRVADLRGANLAGLRGWRAIESIVGANLAGVRNPPNGFLAWAIDTMMAVGIANEREWQNHVQQSFAWADVGLTGGTPATFYTIAIHCSAHSRNDTFNVSGGGLTEEEQTRFDTLGLVDTEVSNKMFTSGCTYDREEMPRWLKTP